MPTIEERLQALEQEHAELKKTIELQTIAIGALVTKTTLERLNEKYDRIFETLIAHDRLTNDRLGDIQSQLTEQDGKIVGLQTEMRQRFSKIDERFDKIETTTATKEDLAALETRILDAFKQTLTAITDQTKKDQE